MKTFENEYSLKKKSLYKSKLSSKKISLLKLIHNIFDTINISLLLSILILFSLSFNSQRKWSAIYKLLSTTKANNNNLIDYISKTEEFYISKLDSLNNFKKTTPKDLIYIDKIEEKKETYFKKEIKNIIVGLKDSRYQIGY